MKEYILYKIRAAGGTDSMIDESAITALNGHSQGNPRTIDALMSDALRIGEQQKLKCINADVIMAAAENRVF